MGLDSLLRFLKTYRFHSGDSLLWAQTDYDDTHWAEIERHSHPNDKWQGMGWFRLHPEVDSTLWDTDFSVSILQAGVNARCPMTI